MLLIGFGFGQRHRRKCQITLSYQIRKRTVQVQNWQQHWNGLCSTGIWTRTRVWAQRKIIKLIKQMTCYPWLLISRLKYQIMEQLQNIASVKFLSEWFLYLQNRKTLLFWNHIHLWNLPKGTILDSWLPLLRQEIRTMILCGTI